MRAHHHHVIGLAGCFPRLADGHVEVVQEGWDSDVLVIDDAWIARFPKRAEVVAWIAAERRLLPDLSHSLPVAVPSFEEFCEQHGAVAYRRIAGEPLRTDRLDDGATAALADDVAAFLGALHRFPLKRACDLGVLDRAGSRWARDYRTLTEGFRRRVVPLLADDERALALQLLDDAVRQAAVLRADASRLEHADLGPAHLLCEDGRLVGVIDWSDCRIGDPALDLAWLLHGTERRFADRLIDAYGGADDLVARADTYHRLGPWHEVVYGLDHDRSDLMARGIAGVRDRLPDS